MKIKRIIRNTVLPLVVATFVTTSFTVYSASELPKADKNQNIIAEKVDENRIVKDDTGKKTLFMSGKFTKPSEKTAEDITKDFIRENDDIIKNNNKFNDFKVKARHDNVYGKTVIELDQTYKGIPVYGTTKYVHIDKDGVVNLVSGYFVPELEKAKGLEASTVLSDKDALEAVKKDIGIKDLKPDTVKTELNVYPEEKNGDALYVYCVNISYSTPKPGNWTYMIDAVSGKVVNKINNIRTYEYTGYGNGVFGNYRTLRVEMMDFGGGNYCTFLYNAQNASSVETLDCQNTDAFSNNYCSAYSNYFSDPEAVDAHYYATRTTEYFRYTHGRNGYDNNDGCIRVGVNYGVGVNNAYMMGDGAVVLGEGDGVSYRSFAASADIVAHEITHAVNESEIGLVYQDHSGAIDESLADVFGAIVEYNYDYNNTNCWIFAEDTTISGTGIRSMSNPPAFGDPDKYSDYMFMFEDNGGVHYNSGILNKAAYLISEGGTFNGHTVSGIGKYAMANIYYRAITNDSITSNATFSQFYNAVRYAAASLYGWGSQQEQAVYSAFAAVEIA